MHLSMTRPTSAKSRGEASQAKCMSKEVHLDSATLGNGDLLARLAAATAVGLDLLDDIHALDNLSKDNMLPVQPFLQ